MHLRLALNSLYTWEFPNAGITGLCYHTQLKALVIDNYLHLGDKLAHPFPSPSVASSFINKKLPAGVEALTNSYWVWDYWLS